MSGSTEQFNKCSVSINGSHRREATVAAAVVASQRSEQQPALPGGPTTSTLLAANFFLLVLGLVTAGWCARGGRAVASTDRGFRVTPASDRREAEEPVEAARLALWLPGFIVTPSRSDWEARELLEVFRELVLLPATRFWDLVRFKSARVPEGDV